ncbi:hypothetical protein LNV23_18955 [Paucibacter sp. DJ1R-11]|uniref:phage tail tube protein n=1 Tax=Paucibacter sp. DJ1R-11 TaxID=2893556 RepID=UPI0021E4E712|nr:phage tail tube protein [Paucibacter sp. DJ1R-11]MCV2365533.1 hypothetical protein [Paucibacter sp. DJ1R-11]
MPRYIKNTAILAKIETTAGTDAVPTGAADAVLVSELSITPLEAQNVDRALVRPFFGASEQLVATAYLRCSFTVELAGSGTAATAPQWGDLLLACATAEALLATPNRVEYTPVSTALKTLTIYWYDDGVLHKMVGAMGNCKLSAKVGDRPKLMFDFMGVDAGISAATPSGVAFTAWKTPPTMAKANVVDITLGCTYATGALSGGSVVPSTGIELDLGNSVNFVALLSNERIDITDRQVSGHVDLDLTAAQEVSYMATVKANNTQGLGLTIGTAAGNKIILFAPAVQLINPTKQELNGSRLVGFDCRFVPVSGNDEVRLITQ